MPENTITDLTELEKGDEIEVSERDTPMEVLSVETSQLGLVRVRAENYQGRYRLRGHDDETISFRAGGKLVSGDVEVTRHA